MASQEMNSGTDGTEGSQYTIGELSAHIGLPEETIALWEKDFGAVNPSKDENGEKIYSQSDVERLKAIKQLAEEGSEVSELAGLSLEDLRACLGADASGSGFGATACRLVVVGAQIEALVKEVGGIGNMADIVDFYPSLEDWLDGKDGDEADLVLLDCPTLFPETVDAICQRIEGSNALRAVIVYQFLKGDTLKLVERSSGKITAMRAPVTARELKLACEADLALASIRSSSLSGSESFAPSGVTEVSRIPEPEEGEAEIPPRQFSDFQLSKISQISTAINCECPHHLASLLSALNAFEQYSRDCENRNADDAALHAFLHRRTARARAIMEDALSVLAEAEGIRVD